MDTENLELAAFFLQTCSASSTPAAGVVAHNADTPANQRWVDSVPDRNHHAGGVAAKHVRQ